MLVQDQALEATRATRAESSVLRDWGLAALFALAFFGLSLLNPDIPDGYDAYRHVKRAAMMVREPWSVSRDVWHLAYLWPKPADAWFGYHLLLAPLTLIFHYIVAAKVLAAALFGGICFVLLRILNLFSVERRAWWLLIAVAGSSVTLHRMAVARPFLLAILLVLAIALFTFKHRPVAVAVAAAIHALSYSMFFLAAMVPGVWLLFRRDRRALIITVACGLGLVLGIVANPYFPQSFEWAVANASVLKIAPQAHVEIGGELMPMKPLWFFLASLPVMIAWVAAVVVRVRQWKASGFDARLDLLLAISVVTLGGSFQVGRTFDFFVPFSVLFAAAILSRWVAGHRKEFVYLAGLVAALCGFNVFSSYHAGLATAHIAAYRAPARYLEKNAPGELVANANWGDYYYLFYWNETSRFVIGIEPTATYMTDPRVYWTWRHLSNDETSTCGQEVCAAGLAQPLSVGIAQTVHAPLIFTQHAKNPRAEAALRHDPRVREEYRDASFSVFRIYSGELVR